MAGSMLRGCAVYFRMRQVPERTIVRSIYILIT